MKSNLTTEEFDACQEVLKHVQMVRDYINLIIKKLEERGNNHDASKMDSPEVEIFAEYTPKLLKTTYGSDYYKQFLEEMKSTDDGKVIPKKFEKYFPDDVAVARIFFCHAKKQFGKYYLTNEAAISCDDEIKMHIVDKMLLHSFKSKKQTLSEFFKGFSVGKV